MKEHLERLKQLGIEAIERTRNLKSLNCRPTASNTLYHQKTMTDQQVKEYHEKVADAMKKYGYHSTFVFGDSTPSFCYSTGVYKRFGIPEIFISALPQNLSHELIANYVSKFKDNGLIPLNEKLQNLTDRFPAYLIEVSKDMLTDYILSSLRFYGNEDFEYVQLVYPDTKGHFPDDIGYDYDQVILGRFKN